MSIPTAPPRPDRAEIASWLIAGTALLAVLQIHLLGALLAGLIVFELVHVLAPVLQRRLSDERAKLFRSGCSPRSWPAWSPPWSRGELAAQLVKSVEAVRKMASRTLQRLRSARIPAVSLPSEGR